jgi:hypothetical protein
MSLILAFEEIGLVWERLPQTVQTRTPKLLYRASQDGLNLSKTYFTKVKPYETESKSCLLFIKTTDDERYGLFFDDIVRMFMKNYSGQFENFLFSSIRGHFHVYKPTSVNPKDFKSDERLFEVGPSRQAWKEAS